MRNLVLTLICGEALLLAAVASPAAAQLKVVVPDGYEDTEGGTGEDTALGLEANTVQQVYGVSELDGRIAVGDLITGMTFRLNNPSGGDLESFVVNNYAILIGQSVNAPGSLSTTLADNRGADTILARSGQLVINDSDWGTSPQSPDPFGKIIDFTNDYTYAGGPLLVEYTHTPFLPTHSPPTDGRIADAALGEDVDAHALVGTGFGASTADFQNLPDTAVIIQLEIDPITEVWDGDVDNLWNSTASSQTNWVSDLLPANGDNVLFADAAGSGNQTVDLNGDRTVGNVTFDHADIYTLTGDVNPGNDMLELTGGSVTVVDGDHVIADSVSVAVAAATDFNLAKSTDRLTIAGPISGTAAITKSGDGALILESANTFSGDASIQAGAIFLSNADALQNSEVEILVNNGLDFTSFGVNANIGALAGSGDLFLGGQNLRTGLNDNNSEYTGDITGNGSSSLHHDGTGTLTLSGGNSAFGDLRAFDGNIHVSGGTLDLTSTVAPALRAGAGGDILINNGATVTLPSTASSTVQNGRAAINGTSIIDIDGAGTSVAAGRFDVGVGLNNDSTLFVGNNAVLNVNLGVSPQLRIGNVDGSAGMVNVLDGGIVNATNVNVGISDGSQGQLNVLFPGSTLTTDFMSLGGTAGVEVAAGGVVTVNDRLAINTGGNSIVVTAGSLKVSEIDEQTATANIQISDGANSALTVGINSGSSTVAGVIADATGGPGSIDKVGTGILTLAGANTFSGGITIDGGTLLAGNTTGSATGSGDVIVNNGGAFGGSGSSAGTTIVNAGGTLAPGTSTESLVIGGNVNFEPDSILEIELGGLSQGITYDLLQVQGNISLGSSVLDVSLIDLFMLDENQQFDIVEIGGSLAGTFGGLDEGSLVGNYNGINLFITYTAGSGNDIALYTVPEPASIALLAAGGLMLLSRSRVRHLISGCS